VNDAPTAVADFYNDAFAGVPYSKDAANGVLLKPTTFDPDGDSPPCSLCAINGGASFKARRAILTGPNKPVSVTGGWQTTTAQKGVIVLGFDGSFTYTPPTKGFTGNDWFFYKSNDGEWPGQPPGIALSGDSAVVQVTITVNKGK
jgi:hypothetical protein